jgi:hypothetical protein
MNSYDITIDQGATFTLGIQLIQNGSALSLTGSNALAQLRKDSGTPILATFSSVTAGSTAGYLSINLTDTVTKALPAGVFHYDVLLTKADSTKSRVLGGKATVSPAISLT